MSQSEQHREAVLAALGQLLAWPDMARSPQLGKFIDYIVRRTIDGQTGAIKAYSIAVDVFGRSPDFDPQSDPIVRVQARRLRSLLDQYYKDVGRTSPLQIRLPVGRYVPEFVCVTSPVETVLPVPVDVPEPASSELQLPPRVDEQLPHTWFVLVAVAGFLAIAAYGISVWHRETVSSATLLQQPRISVSEFVNLAGDDPDGPPVSGLAIELITDLEQFEDLDVHYAGIGLASDRGKAALRDDFSLTGIVRAVGDDFQYSAVLTDRRADAMVWDHTVTIPRSQIRAGGVLDTVSQSIDRPLGSARGPLHEAARTLLSSPHAIGFPTTLYVCRMTFHLYRETGSPSDAARVRSCLVNLQDVDAASAIALAMSGILKAEYADDPAAPEDPSERARVALNELDRALALSPISAFVWEQHARFREVSGERALALTDYGSSLQLNPASTDALAAYARLLAFGGALEEARPLVRSALDGEPLPPAWYAGAPAILALVDGDYAASLTYAERYKSVDRELGAVLGLLAGQGIGDIAVVNRFLPQVLEMASFRAAGILPFLEQKITDPGLIETISQGLVEAGVPEDNLRQPF